LCTAGRQLELVEDVPPVAAAENCWASRAGPNAAR
jgi:hypothetical protein